MDRETDSPRKILVINDEKPMIQLVTLVLEKRGFEVLGAIDGQKGLEAIEKERPDLVILDVMMPGMTGPEVYRNMKADDNLKDIPVIAVVAWQGDDIQERMERAFPDVEGYLILPFSPTELLSAISNIL